jgi:hypothetical protein
MLKYIVVQIIITLMCFYAIPGYPSVDKDIHFSIEVKKGGLLNAAFFRDAVRKAFEASPDCGYRLCFDDSSFIQKIPGGVFAIDKVTERRNKPPGNDISMILRVEGFAGNSIRMNRNRYIVQLCIVNMGDNEVLFSAGSGFVQKENLERDVMRYSSMAFRFLEEPEEIIGTDGHEEAEIAENKRPKSGSFHKFGLSSGVCIPAGDFAGICGSGFCISADYGYGNMTICGMHLLSKSILSFDSFKPKGKNIFSIRAVSGTAGVGYLSEFGRFELIPHAGFGILATMIDSERKSANSGEHVAIKRRYVDPAVYAAVDAGIRIEEFSLFIRPLYFLFFEADTAGSMFSISAGISCSL